MTNLEKYNKAFVEAFGVKETELEDLSYKGIPAWDSVGQMTLIAEIENAFDITLGPDDFMLFNSYEEGKKLLIDNYQVEF